MQTEIRTGAFGTNVRATSPWGFYCSARVLCSDHKVRATARISTTADTFFSVPCAVKVKGKTVAGYLTTDDLFVAYTYGKNAGMLPTNGIGNGHERPYSGPYEATSGYRPYTEERYMGPN